ncbi:(2Fe-2S)-binding protein [Ensifer canadensis]
MLTRTREIADQLSFTFDGETMWAERGETLALALLAAGVGVFRKSAVGGVPRAPYCLMGVCFECLVTVDGVQNRQGCLIEVREGMVVASQKGARALMERGCK